MSAAASPAAPLSFASLSLEKNQSMPMAVRKQAAKPKKTESAAEASPTSPASPAAAKAKPAATAAAPAPAAKAAAPAAAAPAAKKSEPKAAAPAGAGADNKAKSSKPAAAAAASSSASSSPPAVKSDAVAGDKPPRTYYSGFAMVKAVNSGDSLVLAGSSAGGVDIPEKLISLTGVLAPKFGRGKAQTDEPFAWESREYLRKHVIGQQVQFTVQHTLESKDSEGEERNYGVVTLKGTDIAQQMLRAGWVSVKEPKDGGKMHADRLELQQLQDEAKAKGLGMWKKGVNKEDHKRTIDWAPDAQALFNANKNVPMPGVIDQVRDGSTLRVELIHKDNPLKHTMITLYLSGVSCPRTPLPLSVLKQQHDRKKKEIPDYKGAAPTKPEKAEPFAMEAQAFTETRLLNRDVQVILQGVDKSGNLFGSVVFAKGNISLKLLELGLGKLVPWSAALTPDAAKLKAAEAQAKAQKLRTWAQWSADQEAASSSSSGSAQMAEFQGKVVSIPSADSVIVEDASGKEVRVWLASVRVPRLAQHSKDSKKDARDEPFAQEAKEMLRSKLIGHKVRVVPEYVRAAAKDDDRAARQFASVFQNKMNIGEALIAAGYAEALQHRMDEERSQFYDVYLAAESKAKEAKRGKWDLAKQHVAERIVDLTERIRPVKRAPPAAAPKAKKTNEDGTEADAEEEEQKESGKAAAPAPLTKAQLEQVGKSKALSALANTYLSLLQREKKINAVVEFVFSAGRFKLLVPSHHVLISFSLAGIRTPATKGADGKPDPLATEITNYMRAKVQQHSVTIEVEVKDKADNFLGSMFHNRVNLAVDLLEKGYASIFGFSAAKNPYAKDLYAAEAKARENREGMWKDFDFEKEKADKLAAGVVSYGGDEESKQDSGPSERVVKITEIVDAGDFFVQFVGDKNAEAVTKALEIVAAQPEPEQPYQRPENAKGPVIVAGQFSDDSWHRVRLDGVDANGDWQVYFIDFGNHDTLLPDRVRALPADVAKIPALAVHCALSGLTPPKQAEYQEGSALAFSEMAFGVELQACIDFSDKFGRRHVTLSHESHPISVNRQLVRDGWARVQTKPDRRISKRIGELQDEEKYAKDHHYNLFEYGDVSDEEEEGAVRVAGPDPKARPPRGAAPKPAGK